MSETLISLASQYLTPEFLAKISSALGLDRSVISKACSAAVPALFGHFANLAATPEGARKLYGAVNQQNTNILSDVSSVLGGMGQQRPADSGLNSLRSLLGGSSLSGLAGALGKFAGLPSASASSLLGMLSPILMAILGRQSAEQGLSSSGLAHLLETEKDHISAAMPSGFENLLRASDVQRSIQRWPAAGRERSWGALPWILPLVALGLLGWFLFANRTSRVAEQTGPQKTQTQESAAVAGVDLKSSAQKAIDNVSTTLKEIKDEHSAQAALPKLQDAGSELDNVIRLSGQLPEAGKRALGDVAGAAQPAATQLFEKVLAIPGVKEVAKPQIDSLRAKLETLSKNQARL